MRSVKSASIFGAGLGSGAMIWLMMQAVGHPFPGAAFYTAMVVLGVAIFAICQSMDGYDSDDDDGASS